MSFDYCHYIKAPRERGGKESNSDEWIFIPACMGSAARGPHACTCHDTSSEREAVRNEVNKLLRRIDELSSTVCSLEQFLEGQFPGREPIIVEYGEARKRETNRFVQRAMETMDQRPASP